MALTEEYVNLAKEIDELRLLLSEQDRHNRGKFENVCEEIATIRRVLLQLVGLVNTLVTENENKNRENQDNQK